MSKLIGTAPNQVPSNADLGTMAYQDYDVVAPQFLAGRRNLIINGDTKIWQRGTSFGNLNDAYSADRWKHTSYLDGLSITQSSSVPEGQGFQYSMKLSNGASENPGSTNTLALVQSIEGYNFAHLMWGTSNAKNITISFWVRSNLTGTYGLTAFNPASNVRSIQDGSRWFISNYVIDQPNVWQKITLTVPGCIDGSWNKSNSIGLSLYWDLGLGSGYTTTPDQANKWISTASGSTTDHVNWNETTGNDFYITGLQVEAGTIATPFEHRSYGEELALCQRYYQTFLSDGAMWSGRSLNSNRADIWFPLHPNMRSAPPSYYIDATSYAVYNVDNQLNITLNTSQGGGDGIDMVHTTSSVAGLRLWANESFTALRPITVQISKTGGATIAFEAEL